MDPENAPKAVTKPSSFLASLVHQFSASKLARYEWLFPTVPAALLFASCFIRSPKTPVWFDEVISWTLSNDSSVLHMIRALARGADGMPPTYYLVAQMWQRVFGGSTLSLRLLSPLGMSLGIVGAWAALRRSFSFWGSALAITTIFCTSNLLLTQNSSLRPYGLFVGFSGLALWLYSLAAERLHISPGLMAVTAICHGALVLCHPFGIVYSGIFLMALVVSDWQLDRVRVRAYTAIALGWLAFLPWVIPLIDFSATFTQSWIEVPRWQSLLLTYRFGLPWLPVIIAWLVLPRSFWLRRASAKTNEHQTLFQFSSILLATGVVLQFANSVACCGPILVLFSMLLLGFRGRTSYSSVSRSLLNLAIGLLLVPIAVFVISHISTPIFVARYWLPSSFAIAILLAALFDNAWTRSVPIRYERWQQLCLTFMIAIMLVLPLRDALQAKTTDIPLAGVSRNAVEALAPAGKPIIVEDPLYFLPLAMGTNPQHRYYYLLDRHSVLDSKSNHALVTFNMMQVWFDNGYLKGEIVPAGSFLATHADFLVLHSPDFAWFDSHLAHEPSYDIRPLGHVRSFDFHLLAQSSSSSLFEVTRRH